MKSASGRNAAILYLDAPTAGTGNIVVNNTGAISVPAALSSGGAITLSGWFKPLAPGGMQADITADFNKARVLKLRDMTAKATGKIQYVLVADSMVHYADDESTELVRPRLNYLNRPEPVWVESNFATVSSSLSSLR